MTVTGGSIMTHENEIRAIISGWIDAVRAKDSCRMVAGFVPDAYVFDVINPLKYSGIASVRQRVDQWLSSFAGPITYDVHDLRIVAGDEVPSATASTPSKPPQMTESQLTWPGGPPSVLRKSAASGVSSTNIAPSPSTRPLASYPLTSNLSAGQPEQTKWTFTLRTVTAYEVSARNVECLMMEQRLPYSLSPRLITG